MKIIKSILLFNFFILILVLNSRAQTSLPSNCLYLGLSGGDIVQVNLNNWQVYYYPTKHSKYDNVAAIKYFACCDKLVFEVINDQAKVGVIDIKTRKIKYINPRKAGLRSKIIKVLLSTKNDHVIFFITNDESIYALDGKSNEQIKEWKKARLFGRYDVESGKLTKVRRLDEKNIAFFPDGESLRDKLINDSIARKCFDKIKPEHGSNKEYKLIKRGERYDLLKIKDRLAIFDSNPSGKKGKKYYREPLLIEMSPERFGMGDKRLLNPKAVELVIEPHPSTVQ
jgi:hypothetical protein